MLFILIILVLLNPISSIVAVSGNEPYTPQKIAQELTKFKKDHFKVDIIGYSALGQPIWSVQIGTGKECIILFGAHHGREWMTSLLLMKMADRIGTKMKNHDPNYEILDEISIIFVPMVNPDGVLIQQGKTEIYGKKLRNKWFKMNEGSHDFSRWKANAQGIDLNRQYPAGWNDVQTNYEEPSYKFFKGNKPLQAPESKAAAFLIKKKKPLLISTYHSAGQEIFYRFGHKQHLKRDTKIASEIAALTHYQLAKPPKEASGGGLTDWFIAEYNRPALTIEIGPYMGENELPLKVFPDEWQRNKDVPLTLVKLAKKYIHKKDE